MKKYLTGSFVLFIAVTVVLACAGPVRYSQVEAEMEDFRPGTIALLSVDVGPHRDADGVIEKIVAGELDRTGRFARILMPGDVWNLTDDEASRAILEEYLSKREIVNYSDPDLSLRLSEICDVEAFLLVSLTFWAYTLNVKEKEIAKVGLEMELVEASTGRSVWTAHHFVERRYRIFKPELSDLGSSVARRLVQEMPR